MVKTLFDILTKKGITQYDEDFSEFFSESSTVCLSKLAKSTKICSIRIELH